jgi:hypothetical protein
MPSGQPLPGKVGSGWISYLTADGKLAPVVNCNPPGEIGQTCEPQGTRWDTDKPEIAIRVEGAALEEAGRRVVDVGEFPL